MSIIGRLVTPAAQSKAATCRLARNAALAVAPGRRRCMARHPRRGLQHRNGLHVTEELWAAAGRMESNTPQSWFRGTPLAIIGNSRAVGTGIDGTDGRRLAPLVKAWWPEVDGAGDRHQYGGLWYLLNSSPCQPLARPHHKAQTARLSSSGRAPNVSQ